MMDDEIASKRINVIVCDPCPLIYAGLQKSFESDSRIGIQCDTPNLYTLRQKAQPGSFDIALVEWSMIAWHDHASLECLRAISEHSRLVLLGMRESTRERKQALELGVRGIISKKSNARQVRKALCRVAEGGIWLEKSAAETLLQHVFLPSSGGYDLQQRLELLTRREREVVNLVCHGLRNKQIAAKLFISETTVWHHLTSVFGKLQVPDRVALVAFAYRNDIGVRLGANPIPITKGINDERSREQGTRGESRLGLISPSRSFAGGDAKLSA